MSDRLYTRKEVCQILGVHRFTIRRYEREGLIKPALYIKNRPRYTLESIAGVATEKEHKPHND